MSNDSLIERDKSLLPFVVLLVILWVVFIAARSHGPAQAPAIASMAHAAAAPAKAPAPAEQTAAPDAAAAPAAATDAPAPAAPAN